MANKDRVSCYIVFLLASLALNIFLITTSYWGSESKTQKLSWSREAAAEAEAVASISCSGHGKAYLDGLMAEDGNKPICECNTCYGGSDCSVFSPDCAANADGGDPLFLEPFWMQNADSSAVLVSGWHRMSYSFSDKSFISQELENYIRKVHALARNAVTKGKYIVFGVGSTQLLSAAVFALSMNFSSPASVVSAAPYYTTYKVQTELFQNKHFEFKGDASILNNTENVIEFVTSPNNPDASIREPVLKGPSTRDIYDHAYYWPHYAAITAPADKDVMLFTMSKLTGHAGSRFGWAFVKDKEVYDNMIRYIALAEMGTSRESQLRALKLMKAILNGNGTSIFDYAYEKMSDRWVKLSQTISLSKRFTIQDLAPQYCNFFQKFRGPSPAYAWLKCEREEDTNCHAVLQAANILGREGSLFNSNDRYVRLSLLKSDDDFNLLLDHLNKLVAQEDGLKVI